ncbi:maestro heat-like repeat-containing protein family member 7 [Rhineura floridana]|uniref:maestro heat-like repeat-containing protein family member 7 n=1 Tax=Rhineura floridana TaxID=261503 RepID=UPI002AC7EEC4|nr:maestro heat-like repeat-containing protein family member 7 [Rhineura floridana]
MLQRLWALIQSRNANVGPTDEESSSSTPEGDPAVSLVALPTARQHMAFHSPQTIGPKSKDQKKAPSKRWGFRLCRGDKDISVGGGENIRPLWDCCGNCKISPQSYKPLEEKQEPEPHCKMDRLDVHSTTIQHSAILSITPESTNTIGSGTAVSSADSLDTTIQTVPSFHSNRTNIIDIDIIINAMECANSGEKDFLNNNNENISFLRAISTCCVTAHKCGEDTLDLPYTKDELTEVLVMVMETLPVHSVPSFVLSCSMLTVYNLSKMKPPLDPQLESGVLRLALHGIFNMETDSGNPHSQALYRSSTDTMEIMLKGLLSEDPTTSHLLFILEHINFWIHSSDTQERSRAINCSTSLLRHALRLSDFDKSGELPALGHHVAQFGICITDPLEDVSCQARLTINCLYELLLHQMGLSMSEAGELWCPKSEDKKMLAYMDSCRVGELFRKIFTEDQKRTFLQTSLLSIFSPQMRISQAGILLVYSLLGKANEIMGDKAEDIENKVYEQLHKIRILREVPEGLQGFRPSKGDVILENKKN